MWFLLCICVIPIAIAYFKARKIRSSKICKHFRATKYIQYVLKQYFPRQSPSFVHAQVYCSVGLTCTLDDAIYLNCLEKPEYLDFALLHELAHILNRDVPKRRYIAYTHMLFTIMLTYWYEFSWWQSYCLFYVLGLLTSQYSWYGELRADAFAVSLIGSQSGESFFLDPVNCSSRVHSFFTHPPNSLRIARLRKTPQTTYITTYTNFIENDSNLESCAGNSETPGN